MYQFRRDLVAEPRVSAQATLISDFRIRSHFCAPFLPCPTFSVPDKLPADTHLAMSGINEPALEISDVISVTIFHERTNTCFKKADKFTFAHLSNQYQLRIRMT